MKDAIYMAGMAAIIGLQAAAMIRSAPPRPPPASSPAAPAIASYSEQWARFQITQAIINCRQMTDGWPQARTLRASPASAVPCQGLPGEK